MTKLNKFFSCVLLLGLAIGFSGAACQKKAPETSKEETKEESVASPEETPTSAVTQEVIVPEDVGPESPAIFMMTGLKGYTEPCGCTLDVMLGGIDRIVRYVEEAQKLMPASVLVDGGDVLFEYKKYDEEQIPQEKARVEVIVSGLKRLKPLFTVPGPRDMALGTEFYTTKIKEAGVAPKALNMKIDGTQLEGAFIHVLGDQKIAFVPVAQPSLYEGIEGIEVQEPDLGGVIAELRPQADALILAAHGDLAWVKNTLKTYPEFDFGLVGHDPRQTDSADQVGDAFTLEPYDQGRYVGILKLYTKGQGRFTNARSGSKSELEAIDTQIAHVEKSIERLPPATPGEESPMLANLRNRLNDLEKRKTEIRNAKIDVPEDSPSFLWQSVGMLPGYRIDSEMEKVRKAYNRSLKELNLSVDREIVPVPEGEPEYIGSAQCATCHADAMAFWQKTAHAKAIKTLEDRDKDFDHSCVGCHVVGYEKPGGSVLGKLEYSATITGKDPSMKMEITKELENVGCENCHGPGSFHRFQPVGENGPQYIKKGSGVETCMECHVPDHSPRFNYDVYVREITGEGHQLSPQ